VGIWTVFNVLIGLALGLTAQRALAAQDRGKSQILEPWLAVLITGPLVLSLCGRYANEAGQFSCLITLALLAALVAQAHKPGQPALVGACLAIASIKVQTMAPFLLLFLRRSDLRTWLFLGLFLAALLGAAGNPGNLPNLIGAFLEVHAEGRQLGFAGDASLLDNLSFTMIGFDRAFYCVGVGGPSLVGALNFVCIAAVGAWLAYVAVRKPEIPRGAICSLVSLYSMLFLYHRLYDLVVLIIPLVYCASRFRASSGPARWCHAWVLMAIVLALNVPYGEFYRLQLVHTSHPILTALVLPLTTYLVLSALVALALAVSLELTPRPDLSIPERCARDEAWHTAVETR
jgi:hypothetical protein